MMTQSTHQLVIAKVFAIGENFPQKFYMPRVTMNTLVLLLALCVASWAADSLSIGVKFKPEGCDAARKTKKVALSLLCVLCCCCVVLC